MKILYLQFADPGHYPPVMHSARVFVRNGWDVFFLGIYPFDGIPFDLNIGQKTYVKRLKAGSSRISIKIQYLRFLIWSVILTLRFKPDWIYASDHFSAPAVQVIRLLFNVRTIYHEHDSVFFKPSYSKWVKACLNSRDRLAKKSEIVVLPQKKRALIFKKNLNLDQEPICVWNCPSIIDVSPFNAKPDLGILSMVYVGSVSPELIPLIVLNVMKTLNKRVYLTVIGYETVDTRGYAEYLLEYSNSIGLKDQFAYLGPLSRNLMLKEVRRHDIGLSLMPTNSPNQNMQHLAGASNKVFDYLSQGLPVIVNSSEEWRGVYVDAGCAFSCNPESENDIADTLRICLKDKKKLIYMGEIGRNKILTDWNYEKQFEPVLKQMLKIHLQPCQ